MIEFYKREVWFDWFLTFGWLFARWRSRGSEILDIHRKVLISRHLLLLYEFNDRLGVRYFVLLCLFQECVIIKRLRTTGPYYKHLATPQVIIFCNNFCTKTIQSAICVIYSFAKRQLHNFTMRLSGGYFIYKTLATFYKGLL